jgi:hypothetical protein
VLSRISRLVTVFALGGVAFGLLGGGACFPLNEPLVNGLVAGGNAALEAGVENGLANITWPGGFATIAPFLQAGLTEALTDMWTAFVRYSIPQDPVYRGQLLVP